MTAGRGSKLLLYVREDVRDTVRERQAQVLVGLYALVGFWIATNAAQSSATEPETVDIASELVPVLVLFTPLLVLGFFCTPIVEKRTAGSLTVILGLPFARRTVVLGTMIGRSLLITAAVVVSILVAVPIGYVRGLSIDLGTVAGAAFLLVVLAVTFTAIAVLISAVTRTATRATVTAFGTFVVLAFNVWEQLPQTVLYLRHGRAFPETNPTWYEFVVALNPMASFTYLAAGAFPDLEGGTFVQPPQNPAFYERPAFAVVVLLGWIVLATWLGCRRFRATDL